MHVLCTAKKVHMAQVRRGKLGEVLIQGAAQNGVQQLAAPADAQDRFALGAGGGKKQGAKKKKGGSGGSGNSSTYMGTKK